MNNDDDDDVQIKDSPTIINRHRHHHHHHHRPPFICIAVISIVIYLIFTLVYIFFKAGLRFTFDFCGKVDVGGLIDNDCTVIAQPGNGTPDDPFAFAKATDHWPFVHAVMPWLIVMKYTSVILSVLSLGIDLVGPIRTWAPITIQRGKKRQNSNGVSRSVVVSALHLNERNNSETFKRKWVYTIKKGDPSFEKKWEKSGRIVYWKWPPRNFCLVFCLISAAVLIGIVIACFWEMFEATAKLLGWGSFAEVSGDSLVGDMGNAVVFTMTAGFTLYFITPIPVSLLHRYRNCFEIGIEILLFLFIALAEVVGTFNTFYITPLGDKVTLKFGFITAFLLKLLVFFLMMIFDKNIARRTRGLVTQTDVEVFWLYIFLFYSVMWSASLGLSYFTYLANLIGLMLFFVFAFLIKLTVLPDV